MMPSPLFKSLTNGVQNVSHHHLNPSGLGPHPDTDRDYPLVPAAPTPNNTSQTPPLLDHWRLSESFHIVPAHGGNQPIGEDTSLPGACREIATSTDDPMVTSNVPQLIKVPLALPGGGLYTYVKRVPYQIRALWNPSNISRTANESSYLVESPVAGDVDHWVHVAANVSGGGFSSSDRGEQVMLMRGFTSDRSKID